MCGFNEARRLGIIVESLPKLPNGDFENSVADKGLWPDSIEKFLFGDELAWTPEEIAEHGEGFGSELDCFRGSPQALISHVQAEGIEDDPLFTSHPNHQSYRNFTASL